MKKHLFFVATGLLLALATHCRALDVVFRYDDPYLSFDSTNLRVFQLFIDKGVPLTVAVVPCNENEQVITPNDSLFLATLNNNNIEVALHGLTHTIINDKGEFGGTDQAETHRRIRKGVESLSAFIDSPICTFMPPFNAINPALPDALLANNIHILSDHLFNYVYKDSIQYYPETLGHLMENRGIWNAARESIFGCQINGAICVVMFHHYDLITEQQWNQMSNLLDDCLANNNIRLHTFSSLYSSGNTSDKQRYRANQLENIIQKYVLPMGVLLPTWVCYCAHILATLLYVLLALCIMAVGSLCLKALKRRSQNSNQANATDQKTNRHWHWAIIVLLAIFCCFIATLSLCHLLGPVKILGITILGSIILLAALFLTDAR